MLRRSRKSVGVKRNCRNTRGCGARDTDSDADLPREAFGLDVTNGTTANNNIRSG